MVELKKLVSLNNEFVSEKETTTIADVEIKIFKDVFSPVIFKDAAYFALNIPKKIIEGKKILEIGTGTGLIAIKMAIEGAESVIATDISFPAILNARENVISNGLTKKIEIRQGHIFNPVKNQKFDVIFWNIPFGYIDNKTKKKLGIKGNLNDLYLTVYDPYYHLLFEYLREGFSYLNEGGKLLLGFSPSIGKIEIFNDNLKELKLKKKILKSDSIDISNSLEKIHIIEIYK